ncbi:MAG: LLM class F420-dependent oxidoreductase [Actinomycetota bacterium]|nr:LLM class F420-dependent oxidoreductase [Actinomycetota bacterium]
MTARLGFTAPLLTFPLRRTCELARAAEQWGYTDCWAAETSGPDGFSVATAVGIATERIRTGVAVVPVYTRPPALIAMSALAASQASDGRFCLGLGASSPVIVEGWMGSTFERPVTRLRETVAAVRSALAGEKVSRKGETISISGFKLDPEPASPIPLYLAALGPKMLALADEVADGVALYLASEEGVRIATRAVPDKEIVERILCCPDEPEDEVRAFMRWLITPYLAVPAYNRYIAAQGFEDVAAHLAKLWGTGERAEARESIPDELIDALVLLGPAGACKERLESFRDAGLDTPILMFVSQKGGAAIEAALRVMAPAPI